MIGYRRISRRDAVRYSGLSAAALMMTAQAGSAQEGEQVAGSITEVGNLRVGHFTETRRPTGCTVVLFEPGAVAGVDVRGSSPGTRETDLLHPVNTVQQVNAILLSGGSAFGLDAATGVMRYCEEKGHGYQMGKLVVPIVPAAILFDLNVGDGRIRPDAQAGYAACQAANSGPVAEGSVGAGAGATIGKLFGPGAAMKSGLGTASKRIGNTGLIVGALVAVNAVGDVIDRKRGRILAGALSADGKHFRDSTAYVTGGGLIARSAQEPQHGANTTLGIVATNAALTKTEMTKVAQMAQDGLTRSVSPVHTAADGDTIFAAATGTAAIKADTITIGTAAAEAMSDAIERAVLMATSIPGYRALRDLPG